MRKYPLYLSVTTLSVSVLIMPTIEEAIHQPNFKDNFSKSIINLLYTASYLQQRQLQLFKPYDLTAPQFNILRILRGQYPDTATVNLLIERMLDKSSNASRIIDRLESKSLVSRKQCKDDRRAVDVLISELGLQLLEKIDVSMDEWEHSLKNLSDAESIQLNELLDKLRG
ncbi:MAG: DNA-binding MarR family transcriptional regulator [Paraglaciecola sp.]